MPEDVPLLLEQHIGKGEIVDFLWRYSPLFFPVLEMSSVKLIYMSSCELDIPSTVKT